MKMHRERGERGGQIPAELRAITLPPEYKKTTEEEPARFNAVNLGHLDMDTIGAYCIARASGIVSPEAAVAVKNRPSKNELTDPATLNIENQAIPMPAVAELQAAKKHLQAMGVPTTELDTAIQDAKARHRDNITAELYNARQGNVTHTGEQEVTAAAQMWALTGRAPEHTRFAQYLQMVEVTRNFPKQQATEDFRPSFAQVVDRIIAANTPEKGNRSPEQLQQLLNQAYAFFQYIHKGGHDVAIRIPVANTPFAEYAAAVKKATDDQRQLLENLQFQKTENTPAGIRVGLFDGSTAGSKGAFGKINQLRDPEGRLISEVTVLRGEDKAEGRYEVKIAVNKSLSDKVDLQLLAKTLTAFEVVKGEIVVDAEDQFGGHITIIASPREDGTTFNPEQIHQFVCEYFEQQQPPDSKLEEFAAAQEWNGARVVYVKGVGEHGVPERAIEYVDTDSTAISHDVKGAQVYGDKLKLVRMSQIDLETGRVLSDQELLDTYIDEGNVDKALRVVSSMPEDEKRDLLSMPEYLESLWLHGVRQPRTLERVYAPLRSDYFELGVDQMNRWVEGDHDRALARFTRHDSPAYIFDTVLLQQAKRSRAPHDFAGDIQTILRSPGVREAYADGEVYGSLLMEVLNMATGTAGLHNHSAWNARVIEAAPIPQDVRDTMKAFLIQKASVAEVAHMLATIQRNTTDMDPQEKQILMQRFQPLLTDIQQREDFAEIQERLRAELDVRLEVAPIHEDEHPRQVVVIEIGRNSKMGSTVAQKLNTETGGEKESWNVYMKQHGWLMNSGELHRISTQALEQIRALHRRKPDAEIEVYIQSPIAVVAEIASTLAAEGINARFGQWMNGRYVLNPSTRTE